MNMRIFWPIFLTVIIIIGFGVAAYFLSNKKKKDGDEDIQVLDGEGTICAKLAGTIEAIKDNPPSGILVTLHLDEESREFLNDDKVNVMLYPYQYEDKNLKVNDHVWLTYVVWGELEGEPKLIQDCNFNYDEPEEPKDQTDSSAEKSVDDLKAEDVKETPVTEEAKENTKVNE